MSKIQGYPTVPIAFVLSPPEPVCLAGSKDKSAEPSFCALFPFGESDLGMPAARAGSVWVQRRSVVASDASVQHVIQTLPSAAVGLEAAGGAAPYSVHPVHLSPAALAQHFVVRWRDFERGQWTWRLRRWGNYRLRHGRIMAQGGMVDLGSPL